MIQLTFDLGNFQYTWSWDTPSETEQLHLHCAVSVLLKLRDYGSQPHKCQQKVRYVVMRPSKLKNNYFTMFFSEGSDHFMIKNLNNYFNIFYNETVFSDEDFLRFFFSHQPSHIPKKCVLLLEGLMTLEKK